MIRERAMNPSHGTQSRSSSPAPDKVSTEAPTSLIRVCTGTSQASPPRFRTLTELPPEKTSEKSSFFTEVTSFDHFYTKLSDSRSYTFLIMLKDDQELAVTSTTEEQLQKLFLAPDFFRLKIISQSPSINPLIPIPGLRLYHHKRLVIQEELKYDWETQVRGSFDRISKE